ENLRVRMVLNGSVRSYDGTLRITANLDDTKTGYRIWSQTYDRPLVDALAIQREISQSIVAAMRPQLGEPQRITQEPGEIHRLNADAYRAYLKGRYFFEKSDAKSIPQAIGYFEQAIRLDRNYAEAYLGLALCYAASVATNNELPRDMAPKIRDMAA